MAYIYIHSIIYYSKHICICTVSTHARICIYMHTQIHTYIYIIYYWTSLKDNHTFQSSAGHVTVRLTNQTIYKKIRDTSKSCDGRKKCAAAARGEKNDNML